MQLHNINKQHAAMYNAWCLLLPTAQPQLQATWNTDLCSELASYAVATFTFTAMKDGVEVVGPMPRRGVPETASGSEEPLFSSPSLRQQPVAEVVQQ